MREAFVESHPCAKDAQGWGTRHRKKNKLTNPNQSGGRQQKHEGDVHIHGSIEVHPPDSLLRQHTTERQEDAAEHIAERGEERGRESQKARREWLMFGAIAVYAFLTAIQACLTRDLAKTAQQQLASSERPWLGPDEKAPVITGPITIDAQKNISTNYQMSAMSYGNNGANNLWFWAQLYIAQDITTIYDRERYACSQATPDRLGRVIFPQQERIMSVSRVALAMDVITNARADPPQTKFQAYLLACIGYRDHAGNPYHTGTIYRGVKPGTTDSLAFEIVPNSTIPVEWHDWYSFID